MIIDCKNCGVFAFSMVYKKDDIPAVNFTNASIAVDFIPVSFVTDDGMEIVACCSEKCKQELINKKYKEKT